MAASDKVVLVRNILPHVSEAEARHTLESLDGNVEATITLLLEADSARSPQRPPDTIQEEPQDVSSDEGLLQPDDSVHSGSQIDPSFARDARDSSAEPESCDELLEETFCPSSSSTAPPWSSTKEKTEARWEVLGFTDLSRAIHKDVEQVVEFTGVSKQAARVLLSHFGWDVSALLERYAEDPERACKKAGVSLAQVSHSSDDGKCGSCLEDYAPSELSALASCGHRFCSQCWESYLKMKIREGESCRLRCMSFKCGIICDDELVVGVVQNVDPEAVTRFRKAILETYVCDNRTGNLVWCPSAPHCGHAVRLVGKATSEPTCEVRCLCNKIFCFACKDEAHTPCTCDMWKRWREKEAGESATTDWLQANAKPCPRCKKMVEKNGGCNHVTCRCGQSFCWHCGAATGMEHSWTTIAKHTCGRFAQEAKDKAKQAELDLKRYLHYYGRWRSHMDSLKFEAEHAGKVVEKIENLDNHIREYLSDYQWLCDAAAQLSICRRILAHSYIFAFFALGRYNIFADEISESQDSVNTNLFEVKQEELEDAVEKLAKLVETPLDELVQEGSLVKVKQMVLDLTINVDLRSLHLCETAQNDILAKLAHSQGIAPYLPKTMIVRQMCRRTYDSCTSSFSCSSSMSSFPVLANGTPTKRLRHQ
eukprot:TRINITY_DN83204_c0_g1_i1.p1 TRINITY_DN83204_c0_g1~~TRINITY_DN83204_c0_g1_i1.p1  ORF type:complete len:651 (+),score=99.10 TRINITY_DN83204_c0_g1_i1:109-2061(+)